MGIVGVGDELHPDFLWKAYTRGVFPMPENESTILWLCPNPRAVIRFEDFPRLKRLNRTIRARGWTKTLNRSFAEVMRACGENRQEGTWITPSMIEAYHWLHRMGRAHSLEVWEGNELIGGVYGVTVGSIFCAESMFSRVSNGSKAALWFLVDHLRQKGFRLIDCQLLNHHTVSLGATEIPREDYLKELSLARNERVGFV